MAKNQHAGGRTKLQEVASMANWDMAQAKNALGQLKRLVARYGNATDIAAIYLLETRLYVNIPATRDETLKALRAEIQANKQKETENHG